jgi:hypothetical protein
MWAVEDAAKTVAALLSNEMQELPTEILKLDNDTAAIVVEVEGVDYILTMQRVPAQRPRAAVN